MEAGCAGEGRWATIAGQLSFAKRPLTPCCDARQGGGIGERPVAESQRESVRAPVAAEPRPAKYVMRKLPEVVVLFWAIKITCVTLGETLGDEFGITLKVGYLKSASIFLAFFIIAVVFQVRARRFHSPLFWAVILGTSTFGTEASDLMDRGPGHSGTVTTGIGYAWGAAILLGILVAVFLVWWATGQTRDVENIATRKGEILYWIAILTSNTLGTAVGDFLADDTGLGFRHAFYVVAGVMILILAAHYLTRINTMLLFWLAFILTRPLGAAAGDSLVKPVAEGGQGWGTLWGSVVLAALLIGLVIYQTYQVRHHPLGLYPAPTHRVTGEPQVPNGMEVLAYGPHPDQIVVL